MAYDIIIKGGELVDGTGSAPVQADVGILGDTITFIGDLANVNAKKIIDASEKIVAPGFIDTTNHSDTHLTIFKYPQLESLVMQGITTIIGGNCGASLAPLGSKTAIDAIKKWVNPSEININWSTMEEYLREIDGMPLGVNYGTMVGFGTLKRSVLLNDVRPMTLEEKEKVKLLLKESMKAGAYGLSLGLSYGHERISATEEIIEIAKVLSETGGVLKIHLRSEGLNILGSINEAIRIQREIKVPVIISHLKAVGRKSWHLFKKGIDLVEQAQKTGANIWFDFSPYRTTGSPLYSILPPWSRKAGLKNLFEIINNPLERAKLLEDIKSLGLHYERYIVVSAKIPYIVGYTLKELAEKSAEKPEETVLSLLKSNEGLVTILGSTVAKKNITFAARSAYSFLATDGEGYNQDEKRTGNLIHPRSFGSYPHFWHRFVEELKVLKLEEAIKMTSSIPSVLFNIKKRGVIAKGNFADITIFDERTFRDRATYKNPYSFPAGISFVLINGKLAVENGQHLVSRLGKTLRRTA